jgi:hypothetical protein
VRVPGYLDGWSRTPETGVCNRCANASPRVVRGDRVDEAAGMLQVTV